MRYLLVLCVLLSSVHVLAGNYSIPQKLRGRFVCEVPSYAINHNGKSTTVEALSAMLLVYKTKIILRIGERSFPANVERQIISRNNPEYKADFPAPFNTCRITFDRRKKTILIDSQVFQNIPFERVR